MPDAIVERTYKDFEWLAEEIYAEFPGYIPPAIPQVYNTAYEDNRRRALEQYLNRLSRHKVLRKSLKLESFLLANDASFAWMKESSLGRAAIVLGTNWFKGFSFFDLNDRMSRHKEIDLIFEYVTTLDEWMEEMVERTAALVQSARVMTQSSFGLAQSLNLLGELEEGAVGEDLIEIVAAFNETHTAYEVYAQSLSEDLEEPLREYTRLMYSIRRALLSREEAWTRYINAKADVVRGRDKLSKSLLLSKVIGSEGREELIEERTLAVDASLAEEKRSLLALEAASDALVKDFRRFIAEKREDLRRIVNTYADIELLFARRRAQIWGEASAKLSSPVVQTKPRKDILSSRSGSFKQPAVGSASPRLLVAALQKSLSMREQSAAASAGSATEVDSTLLTR